MSQVVSSQPYCLENSVHLTRTGSESLLRSDFSNAPTIIDKHQAKRLYRLQRTPYVNTRLYLDQSEVDYGKPGHFESILRKQIDESSLQPTKSVYHRPTDMSNASMAKFSLGKARFDPQHIVPSETTIVRNHPSAIGILRPEQDSNNERVPVSTDRKMRARIGLGHSFNHHTDYHRNQSKTDELARKYMYTSVQQAALNDVTSVSKLPSKKSVLSTSYEADGSDPIFKSTSLPSFHDTRSYNVLEWDRLQSRNGHFNRKPFLNVAPLSRAQQISGYSGAIGGHHLQDIEDPTIDFKPYTVVRTEQPKFTINSFNANIPSYTGKTHWTKVDPTSHYDQSGHGYTTTAAFHKSLPNDNSLYRHASIHGLSRSVTTVPPQNPFNQLNNNITTTNTSIDSRPSVIIRQLPTKIVSSSSSPREKEQIIID